MNMKKKNLITQEKHKRIVPKKVLGNQSTHKKRTKRKKKRIIGKLSIPEGCENHDHHDGLFHKQI